MPWPWPTICAAFSVASQRKRGRLGRQTASERWCLNYPVAASLLFAFTFCLVFGFWYMTRLSDQLVHAAALENAAQQSDVLREVNDSYSEVVKRAQAGKLEVRHDYQEHSAAIPIPATFTIELGQQISDRSDTGVQIRLYSAYPFRSRRNGGPRDDFEREACDACAISPPSPSTALRTTRAVRPCVMPRRG